MKIKIHEGFPNVEIHIKCPQSSDEIRRVESILKSYDEKLSGTKDGQTYMVDRHEILYFESVDKRCFICTDSNTFETPLRLYKTEERLADMGFIRCSKSQIVNITKNTSLCPDFGGRIEITIENCEKIIVSCITDQCGQVGI